MIKKSLILFVFLAQFIWLNASDLEEAKNACSNGDVNACYTVGSMYEYGKNIEANEKKAIKYYKKSCEGKNSDACERLDKIAEESMVGGC